MRILVVDDELDIAQSIALLLKNEGHAVSYAVTAKAALDLAAKQRPEVVVLDLGLPDMDGLDLAKRLRTLHGQRAPRIICVTGRRPEAEADALAAGCARFVRKPIDLPVLDSLIRETQHEP